MLVLVLTASLLIRSIVGNLEIESSNLRKLSRFEFSGRSNSEIRRKYENSASKPWDDSVREQSEMDLTIENKRQRIPKLAQISKRSEFVPNASWMYAAIENKIPTNEEWSQENWEAFNPWDEKRTALYQTDTRIRRPIRIPFNSWGGKRGREIGEEEDGPREKKSKDRPARDEHRLLEGYAVKRLVEGSKEGWKAPFKSWGGKRSQSDLDQRVTFSPDKDDEPTQRTDKIIVGENIEEVEEKRAAQMKNSKGFVRFNSWGGKRNQPDYQVLSAMHSEIGTDYEGQNQGDDNDWYIIV